MPSLSIVLALSTLIADEPVRPQVASPLAECRIVVPERPSGPIRVEAEVLLPNRGLQGARELGGENWAVLPGRDGMLLRRRKEPVGEAIAVGRPNPDKDPAAPVQMEISDPKIRQGKPGRVMFTIAEPAALRERFAAGIFRGELVVELKHEDWDDGGKAPIRRALPVTLEILGHRPLPPRFLERSGEEPLRAGRRASLELAIESVDVEAGAGRLELDWTPEGAAGATSLLRLPLPLPTGAWDPRDAKEGRSCHASWLDEPILANEATEPDDTTLDPSRNVLTRRILLTLPDFFGPGTVQGRIAWGSAKREFGPIRVDPGLIASPRLAFLGEPIQVRVEVGKDDPAGVESWGSTLAVDLTGPGGEGKKIELKRQPGGGPVATYLGQFRAGREGEYRAVVADDAPPSARQALGREVVEILVPIRLSSRLDGSHPLIVFIGSPPIWWDFVASPEDGAKQAVRRRGAIELDLRSPGYSGLVLRPSGLFEDGLGRAVRPHDDSTAPTIRFVAEGQDESTVEDSSKGWPVAEGKPLVLDLEAALRKGDSRSQALAEHPRLERWMLSGIGPRHQPIGRLFPQRFRVRVASQGEYYLRYGWIPALVLGLGLVLIVVHRMAHRDPIRPTRSLSSAEPPTARRPAASTSLLDDGPDDGDPAVDFPQASAPARPRPLPVDLEPSKGPEPTSGGYLD